MDWTYNAPFCLIAALAAFLIPSNVFGQRPACEKRGAVVSHLAKKYDERSVAMGLANNGGILEVFSSKSGGSWTIFLTMPNGVACFVAAGESWEVVSVKVGESM